jgi:hypothetical protein
MPRPAVRSLEGARRIPGFLPFKRAEDRGAPLLPSYKGALLCRLNRLLQPLHNQLDPLFK